MTSRIGKAAVINKVGGSDVFEYVTDFVFDAPKDGEVVVHNVSSSVNPIDYVVRQGFFGPIARFPKVLGGDLAGVVVEAPAGSKFKVGDKVYGGTEGLFPHSDKQGSYGEFVNCKEEWLAHVPDNLPLSIAGGVPLVALTAWQAFEAAEPKAGQRILILSASSSVGLFAVQFAKAKGLHVVGTAGARNLELVKSFGADDAVDYEGGEEALGAKYGGSADTRFDVILDIIGGRALHHAMAELARPGAAVSTVAIGDKAAAEAAAAAAAAAGLRWSSTFAQCSGRDLGDVSALIASGHVRLHVGQTLPLAEVGKGHDLVSGKHPGGKVIITI